jgi:hypothetical protein
LAENRLDVIKQLVPVLRGLLFVVRFRFFVGRSELGNRRVPQASHASTARRRDRRKKIRRRGTPASLVCLVFMNSFFVFVQVRKSAWLGSPRVQEMLLRFDLRRFADASKKEQDEIVEELVRRLQLYFEHSQKVNSVVVS